MVIHHYRRRTCRLCGSGGLTTVLTLRETPLADAYVPRSLAHTPQRCYPLTLVLCKRCAHVQLFDVVHPKNIYVDYIYETVSSLGLVEHFHDYAREVQQYIKPSPGSLIVDIGSNDGTLLSEFKKLGFRVLGIDPARDIAQRATTSGIETLPDFFTLKVARLLRKNYGPAAVVTANNLYANIDNLDEFMNAIKKLLSPDGVFIFESFYLMDCIENLVFDFIYHEHVSYFSVKPLIRFFRKHGMELIDVLRVPTKGGSLRFTVQLAGGPRKISSSVEELVSLETAIGLQKIKTFTSFAKRITNAKRELLRFLRDIQKQKKTIAGYGASATTTTLLYHFDLNDTVQYLLDDYPKKYNTFTPGYHIPVVPSDMIYTRRPDYIVILAWRYAEPIVVKHKRFLQEGGHFIIPLPRLRVI